MTTAIQTALPEMAVCPLVDKACWEEFRRRIKDVTLAWNYREWLNTCLLDGPMWKRILSNSGSLDDGSGDGSDVKVKEEQPEKKKEKEKCYRNPNINFQVFGYSFVKIFLL